MFSSLLSSPFAHAIEHYLAMTDSLIMILLDEQLVIAEYNDAFFAIIKGQEDLRGKSILDFMSVESEESIPFKDPLPERSQRMIFVSRDRSSFSMDCSVYHVDQNFLVIGGHLMLMNDQVIEGMTVMTNELMNMTRELQSKNRALEEARAELRALGGQRLE